MNIRSFTIITVLLLLWSCTVEEKGFTVSGELRNAAGQMVYLEEMTSSDLIPVDSSMCDSSGSYILRGISAEPRFYALHTRSGDYVYLLARTGEQISLSGDALDLPGTYHVEGSDESRLIRELTSEQNRTMERIRRLSKIFNDSLQSPDFENIKAGLDTVYESIINAQREFPLTGQPDGSLPADRSPALPPRPGRRFQVFCHGRFFPEHAVP